MLYKPCIYLVSVFCAAPLHLTNVVHVDIQGKIMQWSASSFSTGNVKFTSSLLSEVPIPTGKAIYLRGAVPMLKLVTGQWLLGTIGLERGVPLTSQTAKPFQLLLQGVWSSQYPCKFLEPYVRVGCRSCITTIPISPK